MYAKTFLLSLVLLITAYAVCFASVRGTGQIIQENPSVRGAGMGYAYVANIVDDAFGIFSNPAYSVNSPLAGISYSMLLNGGKTISEYSSAAFSFLYPELFSGVNIGIAAVSSLEGNIKREQDSAVYLNLSGKIEFLKVGVNAKYINSEFYRGNGSGSITADAGISATFGKFTFGAAGYNLLGEFKDESGEKVNPSLSAAAAVDFNIGEFMLGFSAGISGKNINENKINPQAGFEIFYRFAALRCGYEYNNDLKDNGSFSAGLGFETKSIIFDYAFIADQNSLQTGDMHKAAFSYRFYTPPKVNNQKYIQQLKYEKQQAKIAKQKRKRQKLQRKEKAAQNKNKIKKAKASKSESLPLQPVEEHEYGHEFTAVLIPEWDDPKEKPQDTAENKKPDYQDKQSLKNKKTAKQEKAKGKNQKKNAEEIRISVEDNEFDAARYILENPGKHKIKQYYIKPTKTSKDDFDAALYLLEREKSGN